MTPARPLAVLFDLWGTLVAPRPERRDAVSRVIAGDLGVDPGALVAAISVSHGERFVGSMGSLVETLRLLARRCGGEPTADALELAAARRLELTSELLDADAGTLAALDDLRAAGLRLGLVSDSSVEVPTVWPDCPLARRFDATAFSCLLGLRKPAREMYLSVTRRLGVTPAQCLYVGDGDSRELSGAVALGMTALRLRSATGEPAGRYEDDTEFAGPEIRGLDGLVGSPWLGASRT